MKHERGASGSVFVYLQFGLFVNVGVMSPNVQKSVWDLVLLACCTIQGTIEQLHMSCRVQLVGDIVSQEFL